MRNIFLVIIMMSIVQTIAIAQQKSETKEVEAAVEELRAAMISGDKKALEDISAEELSYGHSGGHVENQAEFVDKIASGKSDFVTIDLSNQQIQLVDNVAIVRHDLTATTNDNGKAGNVHLHVLSVWLKRNGKWKMVARQAVKLTH